MAGARFTYDHGDLRKNLHELPGRIDRAISIIVDRNAAWGQGWARGNAPWTDRTSAARSGLFAFPKSMGGHHEILITHSVHYGIWLEIANSGKYQIILPAVRATGQHLMSDLRGLLNKL